jgi:hypothetical protein
MSQAQYQQAQSALRGRNYRQALSLLTPLLNQAHVIDYEYDNWLRSAAEAYLGLQDPLPAAYIYLYLHYFDMTHRYLDQNQHAMGVARAYEQQKHFNKAARIYLQAQRFAHAAVAHERAQEYGPARAAWEALLQRRAVDGDGYLSALVHLNLGLCCVKLDDKGAAHEHFVSATRFLEESADEFEARGEKDRAFDCYQVLLKLGKDAGSYENLAEGYLNSIRVLKEDNLKFYVLQYYEDFQKLSVEREEFHAAATLFREAAEYCARLGLEYDRFYEAKAAEAWLKAAESNSRRGGPPELGENALLAAIDGFNQIGDYRRVREAYQLLVALPLHEKRRRRYEEILGRYQNVPELSLNLTAFPEYLRQPSAYADIWYADIIEWEQGGDPFEVCASLVGNATYPDVVRRKALKVLIQVHDAQRNPNEMQSLARIAESLGEISAYAVLSPLEKLANHEGEAVRAQAVGATKHLYFKRSFVLVRKGLSDSSPEVREQALRAMKELHFNHAFEPLSRIYREHDEARVKKVALRSIGRIFTIEAGEFLLEVMRYETGDLPQIAEEALSNFENPRLASMVEQQLLIEAPNTEVRRRLERIRESLRGGARFARGY